MTVLKRGRPRKHNNNAVKQAEYRRRKQDQERKELVDAILWKTRILPGQQIEMIERELLQLSIRQLKDKLQKVGKAPSPIERESRRGRKRKHANNAEKQDAYRKRKYGPERRRLVDTILLKAPRDQEEEFIRARSVLSKLSIRKLREKLRLLRLREFRNKPEPFRNTILVGK